MTAAGAESPHVRPDLVRPELRWIGIFILVVPASVLLYLFAVEAGKKTDSLLQPGGFAWPVKPEMMAMFMGSCYGAGAYFFYRVSFGGSWHAVAAYFPGIAVFAWLMGSSTFLHWDKFNHDHVAFFAWLSLYVTTPLLVPLLYLRNRAADPGSPNLADAVVPRPLRALIGIGGATLLVIALVMYLAPSAAIDAAPWKLTPLTSRVIAAFLSASGTAALLLSRDPRWSAWQVFVRSGVFASALLLIAALRLGRVRQVKRTRLRLPRRNRRADRRRRHPRPRDAGAGAGGRVGRTGVTIRRSPIRHISAKAGPRQRGDGASRARSPRTEERR